MWAIQICTEMPVVIRIYLCYNCILQWLYNEWSKGTSGSNKYIPSWYWSIQQMSLYVMYYIQWSPCYFLYAIHFYAVMAVWWCNQRWKLKRTKGVDNKVFSKQKSKLSYILRVYCNWNAAGHCQYICPHDKMHVLAVWTGLQLCTTHWLALRKCSTAPIVTMGNITYGQVTYIHTCLAISQAKDRRSDLCWWEIMITQYLDILCFLYQDCQDLIDWLIESYKYPYSAMQAI